MRRASTENRQPTSSQCDALWACRLAILSRSFPHNNWKQKRQSFWTMRDSGHPVGFKWLRPICPLFGNVRWSKYQYVFSSQTSLNSQMSLDCSTFCHFTLGFRMAFGEMRLQRTYTFKRTNTVYVHTLQTSIHVVPMESSVLNILNSSSLSSECETLHWRHCICSLTCLLGSWLDATACCQC